MEIIQKLPDDIIVYIYTKILKNIGCIIKNLSNGLILKNINF